MSRDTDQLVSLLERRDLVVTRTRGNHLKVTNPATGAFIFISGTPSGGRRGLDNAKGDVKRHLGVTL